MNRRIIIPEKKTLIENKSDYYQRITTISIINNHNNNESSSEEEITKITNNIEANNAAFAAAQQLKIDTESNRLANHNDHETTTEYKIRILTEKILSNDEDGEDDDYNEDRDEDDVDDDAEECSYYRNGEEDNITQIVTYENSIIQKNDDSKESESNIEEDYNDFNETKKDSLGTTSANTVHKETHDLNESNQNIDTAVKRSKETETTMGVPQTLISCLNELQCGGNLISWKITGQGENLTVKITWSNEQNMKSSKHILNKNFLNEALEGNRLWQIGNSSDYDDLNNLFFKNNCFGIIQSDLSNFRSKFKNCIKCLISGLASSRKQKKGSNECKHMHILISSLFFSIDI